jgi:hypothetical protein
MQMGEAPPQLPGAAKYKTKKQRLNRRPCRDWSHLP